MAEIEFAICPRRGAGPRELRHASGLRAPPSAASAQALLLNIFQIYFVLMQSCDAMIKGRAWRSSGVVGGVRELSSSVGARLGGSPGHLGPRSS